MGSRKGIPNLTQDQKDSIREMARESSMQEIKEATGLSENAINRATGGLRKWRKKSVVRESRAEYSNSGYLNLQKKYAI